jgi:hypothetical protein
MAEESKATAAERALFPDKEVRLLGGKTVVIKPWGMQTGKLLNPRVVELMMKMRGFSFADLAQLVVEAQDEVYDIIQRTIEWDDEKMDALAYEDLFTLAQAVIDVCIVRPSRDGGPAGGVAGKLLALAGLTVEGFITRAMELAMKTRRSVTEESLSASNSSSPSDTSSTPSESTPLSN